MKTTVEEWRPVVGWEGYYEVSNLGRVRSLPRLCKVRGTGFRMSEEKVLKPLKSWDRRGYEAVDLTRNGRRKMAQVHRLVAEAFVPNPEKKPNVLHWDDNPSNNRVENLRWGSQQDNAQDMIRNGSNANQNTFKTHCKRGHPLSGRNLVKASGTRQCRECTAMRKREFRERQEAARKTLKPGDERHGTRQGYDYYGCKCGPCVKVKNDYQREYRKRKNARTS